MVLRAPELLGEQVSYRQKVLVHVDSSSLLIPSFREMHHVLQGEGQTRWPFQSF